MTTDIDYDLVIIGAGVLGLSSAASASTYLKSILVIEKHKSFGFEVSSRNSEVIHAGIYYPENSLKASLCVKGNESLYKWCDSHKVTYKKIGKYIISTSAKEEHTLEKIFAQGNLNGARNLKLVSKDELQKAEPNVKGTMAIYSPSSGIVDSHELMKSFLHIAKQNGCDFAWRHTIVGIEKLSSGYKLIIEDPAKNRISISAAKIINAAGLESDSIAELLGIDIEKAGYCLKYKKGNYFRLGSDKADLVNHLIYPIPASDNSSLGLHLTLDLNGGIKIGPDSEYLEDRDQDYKVNDSLKEKLFEAVNQYVYGLKIDDLHPDMSGIRPSLRRKESEIMDFIIEEESEKGSENWINLIGIDSPGLTCCIEIATMCNEMLGLEH